MIDPDEFYDPLNPNDEEGPERKGRRVRYALDCYSGSGAHWWYVATDLSKKEAELFHHTTALPIRVIVYEPRRGEEGRPPTCCRPCCLERAVFHDPAPLCHLHLLYSSRYRQLASSWLWHYGAPPPVDSVNRLVHNDSKMSETAAPKKRSHHKKKDPLPQIPRKEARSVQHMFRTSLEEHAALVKTATESGFETMTDFIRARLGLTHTKPSGRLAVVK